MIVALTGHANVVDHRGSADCGVDLHLAKPVDPFKLAGLLAKVQGDLANGREAIQSEADPAA